MAILKDSLVQGSMRVTDTLYSNNINISDIITAKGLVISSTAAEEHIQFSRTDSINYILFPDNTNSGIAVGYAVGTANCPLIIQKSYVFPGGTTETINLGSSSNRWNTIYGKTGNFSGAISSSSTITASSNITAGSSTAGAEVRMRATSNAGNIYLYSDSSATGNRGIYGYNAANTGAAVITVNQSNQISAMATVACSPTITGTLTLSKTTDASGTANNSPALIVGGAATSTHLELDANEIMAKTNGTSVASLYINNEGGAVIIDGGYGTTSVSTAVDDSGLRVYSRRANNKGAVEAYSGYAAAAGSYTWGYNHLAPNIAANANTCILTGVANSANNQGVLEFHYEGSDNAKNYVGLGLYDNNGLLKIFKDKHAEFAGTITVGTWQGTAIAADYIGAHNHAAGDINSGTLSVARGGTGLATTTNVNAVLIGNSSNAANTLQTIATASGAFYATAANAKPAFGTLPIAQGGTGLTKANPHEILMGPSSGTAQAAPTWRALVAADIPILSITDKTTGTLTVARGGTGATTAAEARTNLGTAPYIQGVFYGTCATAQATKAKQVILTNGEGFALDTGVVVFVKFTYASAAATMTMAISADNGSTYCTAKNLYRYATTTMSSGTTTTGWRDGAMVCFVYDGTGWECIFWENTTYTVYNQIYCTTAAATAAKVGTGSQYADIANTSKYFMVTVTNTNTSQSALTFNINSQGAKPIYINGVPSSTTNYTLPAGFYLVHYDGTNYYFRTDNKMTGNITGHADQDLALSGGTMSGNLVVSNTSAESIIQAANAAGTIYLYSQSSTTGYRGIYGTNAAGTGAGILYADQDNHVHISQSLILSKTQDASGTANNYPALIVGGLPTSTHLELDANEIMAKTNGTSTADLFINTDGGGTTFGGMITVKGRIVSIATNATKGTTPTSNVGGYIPFGQSGTSGTTASDRIGMLYSYVSTANTTSTALYAYQNIASNSTSAYLSVSITNASTPVKRTYTDALIYGAVWNDYAEYRASVAKEPGRVLVEDTDGIMKIAQSRLLPGCRVYSDTFGMAIGETAKDNTPIAVSGRVLAYPYRNRSEYHLGEAVCSAPNGTIDIMSREEIMTYPERIIGTVSEIPDYEEWECGYCHTDSEEENKSQYRSKVKVNGRIWIYVR